MKKILRWIAARGKERSTWVGLTMLLTVFGVQLSPEKMEAIATFGTSIAALIAIFTADKDAKKDIKNVTPPEAPKPTVDDVAKQLRGGGF